MGIHEVIMNLWYVRDGEGIIYSLRAKAYVAVGSDEEKLIKWYYWGNIFCRKFA